MLKNQDNFLNIQKIFVYTLWLYLYGYITILYTADLQYVNDHKIYNMTATVKK
jgi:hypothetical protein